MKKRIDDLGRIVLPQPFRKELGIEPNQELEVTKEGNKIIIGNPKSMRTKEEIEQMYNNLRNLEARGEYDKGFENALRFVLRKEGEKHE